MHILITGATGRIGSVLAERLGSEHRLRGLDVRLAPSFPGEFVLGDCADPAVTDAAVAGVDAVVHLAGTPDEAALPTILRDHVESTAALLDAMVKHGVGRMVYASSNHAVGMTERMNLLTTDVPPRPDTFYGVGKVAAEGLLSLYADRHGITSVAMRIGTFAQRPESVRELSTWLSYDDCVALVTAALTAEVAGVLVVYGISDNRDAWWDLRPGRSIGYHPKDDAAAFETAISHQPFDEEEGARVGGPQTTAAYARRPFDPIPTHASPEES